jgi:hypothetical protein
MPSAIRKCDTGSRVIPAVRKIGARIPGVIRANNRILMPYL